MTATTSVGTIITPQTPDAKAHPPRRARSANPVPAKPSRLDNTMNHKGFGTPVPVQSRSSSVLIRERAISTHVATGLRRVGDVIGILLVGTVTAFDEWCSTAPGRLAAAVRLRPCTDFVSHDSLGRGQSMCCPEEDCLNTGSLISLHLRSVLLPGVLSVCAPVSNAASSSS